MNRHFQAIVLIVLVISRALRGQTIDFEKVPGVDVPIDGLAISNQFQLAFGVRFSLEDGSFPVLARPASRLPRSSSPTTHRCRPPPGTTNRFYRAAGIP